MDGQCTKCRRNIAENFNRLSMVHERYRQTTDDRQTDRQTDTRTGDSPLKTCGDDFWCHFHTHISLCEPIVKNSEHPKDGSGSLLSEILGASPNQKRSWFCELCDEDRTILMGWCPLQNQACNFVDMPCEKSVHVD